MTVPTKAAMKQLLDERMIAGSASNWLPPAMFFLQLNLSGVIILLSLMFYANALGESFVRGLVCWFFSSFFLLFSCVMYVWGNSLVKLGWVRGSVGGGVAFGSYMCVCACVSGCIFLLSTMKIFAFFWALPVLPWLFPVCIRVFSHEDHTVKVTSHAVWGGEAPHQQPATLNTRSFSRGSEESILLFLGTRSHLVPDDMHIDIRLNVLTWSHHDRWRRVANLGDLDTQYGISRWPTKVWRVNNSLFSHHHRFLSSTVPVSNNIIMSLHPATLTLSYLEECFSRK